MKIKTYTSAILLLVTVSLTAQIKITESSLEKSKTLPKEQVFVHYNTNFLLTGESLYFKIYNLYKKTKTLSSLSKIAYIKLLDINKKAILKRKIILKEGEGYGDIFIPSDIKSGNYKLIAYTKWMKNTNSYFEDDILIINPFEKKIIFNHEPKKSKKKVHDFTYNTRSLVTINLKDLIDTNGKYSISIRKDNEGILSKKKSNQDFYDLKEETFLKGSLVYLPEFRGQLITGKVTPTSNDTNLKDIKVGLSVIGNDQIFKITSTNDNGDFFFNIAEPFHSEKIFCKLIDKNKSTNYKISFPIQNELDFKNLKFPKTKTTQDIIKTINDRSINIQVQNAYNETTKDSIMPFNISNSIFEDKLISYNLDDYKRFNTIEETFIEIIENAWIGKKNGENKVFVRNSGALTNFNLPTLIIIDGFIITDYEEFIDINPKKVKTISLLREKYKYNSKLYEGIIFLESKKESYTPKDQNSLIAIPFQNIFPRKKYFHKNYYLKEKSRVPDFRSQLLWEPEINTINKKISFYTSDIKGYFTIEIQGFSKKGTPINIIKFLKVK
ncbi:hypothetical protein [Tenacibaculum ascidiaceicola]|uniref:hypothetical protein n=1 Tax=Tenacibaculum ascidiaceicola TaxID=1699411 RepID=UPI003CE4C431